MAPSAVLPDPRNVAYGIFSHDTSIRKAPSIQASVLHGPRDLRLETRSISDPEPHELQIAIKATGICGSDVSYYQKFRNGSLRVTEPLSLGHESSGVVVAVGEAVSDEWTIGDRVALEVGVPCDVMDGCRACRCGRYNLCPRMRFRSSAKSEPHYQGTLQERVNHPAKWCYRIPDHVSFESAAMLEPLSVAIHATRRAAIEQGDTVVIFGAGPIGLLTAAMAKLSGATRILIADVDAGRVAYAFRHGFATKGYIVAPPRVDPSGDMFENAQAMAAETFLMLGNGSDGYYGADVTFDCTGKEVCMQAGLYATKPGGKLVMVGMGTPVQTLPMAVSHLNEVDIIGIFRYANTYPVGLEIIASGLLPRLDQMVTHRFQGLEKAEEAFELAGRTVDGEGNLVLKVVVEV